MHKESETFWNVWLVWFLQVSACIRVQGDFMKNNKKKYFCFVCRLVVIYFWLTLIVIQAFFELVVVLDIVTSWVCLRFVDVLFMCEVSPQVSTYVCRQYICWVSGVSTSTYWMNYLLIPAMKYNFVLISYKTGARIMRYFVLFFCEIGRLGRVSGRNSRGYVLWCYCDRGPSFNVIDFCQYWFKL